MAARHLRWGFDARLAGVGNTGIGRYSEEILHRVLLWRSDVDWVVWVRSADQLPWLSTLAASAKQLGQNVEIRISDVSHYSFREQTDWVLELLNANLDMLHVPHFNVPLLYSRPFLITIHDLLWHSQKDARATTLSPLMHSLKYAGYRLVSESAIRRAQAILVPSNTVRSELERVVPTAHDIHVTYEGIPGLFQQAPPWTVADQQHQPSPFFVYIGNLYPHKNLIVVLQAMQKLPKYHLKIVGARSVFLDRIHTLAKELGVLHQLDFCGFVPDLEMVELYRQAIALVQPSLSEGFGLPVLEALAVGCPVLTSDIPIFHEIGQTFVQYIDPHDAGAWVEAMTKQIQHSPTISWRQEAQAYAQGFTWDKTAAKTMAVYEQVLGQ